MRAHYYANVMGSAITVKWEHLPSTHEWYEQLAADEWVVTPRIDPATGENFASWEQFFGPNGSYHGDPYTSIQQYNLSSEVFIDDATDEAGFDMTESSTKKSPYSAGDIVLLTDGICASSCSLFGEMMHHQAGVQVVVAGGRPVAGPMQGYSGTRGARAYDIDTLDQNIEFADSLLEEDNSPLAYFMGNRSNANDMYITDAKVNLRDQIREGVDIPLQFTYEAADCRIYYTPQTVYNYTNLWKYTADAIWTNRSLCVANSTGYATGQNASNFDGPTSDSSSSSYSTSPVLQYLLDSIDDSNVPSDTDGAADAELLTSSVLDDAGKSANDGKYTKPASYTKRKDCVTANKGTPLSEWVCVRSKDECSGQWGNANSTTTGICVQSCTTKQASAKNKCITSGVRGDCTASSGTKQYVGSQAVNLGYCKVPTDSCANWKSGNSEKTYVAPAAGSSKKS